jgi:hypothetical protein
MRFASPRTASARAWIAASVARSRRSRAASVGSDGEHGARGPRGQRPVLGGADAIPGRVRHAEGIRRVSPPEREGRRRLVGRNGVLRVGQELQLHEEAAQRLGGLFPGGELGLDRDEADRGVDERDPCRRPRERVHREVARLAPPSQLEERVDGAAPQSVAVDSLETCRLGGGDPRVRDPDRLLAPALEIEDRGEVGAGPERVVEPIETDGDRERTLQARHRRFGPAEPAVDDAERAQRVPEPGIGARAARLGSPDRLLGEVFRVREGAFQHPDLAQGREHAGPLKGLGSRQDLQGPPVGDERTLAVAALPAEDTEAIPGRRARCAVARRDSWGKR